MISTSSVINLRLGTRTQPIAYFDRPGSGPVVLFVHGLGNAAANFEEMLTAQSLRQHRLIALDFPGCGDSPYDPQHPLNVDGLVDILDAFVEALDPPSFMVVGASLGGLVALLYAERKPTRLMGFLNVEGNLAPEDCMFSRLVVPHSYETFERDVFPQIKRDVAAKPGRGFARHLSVLNRANPRAYYDFSFQTVQYSDHGELITRFLALPIPIHFVYGSSNRSLSYLPQLRSSRCRVTEIADAGHFLFYDQPVAFAECVRDACAGTTTYARDYC